MYRGGASDYMIIKVYEWKRGTAACHLVSALETDYSNTEGSQPIICRHVPHLGAASQFVAISGKAADDVYYVDTFRVVIPKAICRYTGWGVATRFNWNLETVPRGQAVQYQTSAAPWVVGEPVFVDMTTSFGLPAVPRLFAGGKVYYRVGTAIGDQWYVVEL